MKNTYKKFNLEEALNGAKLETREGRKVKEIVLFEDTNNTHPFIAVVENNDVEGDDCIFRYTTNGRFLSDDQDNKFDLFIVEEPKTYYINVYKDFGTNVVTIGGKLYNTEEEAKDSATDGFFTQYLKTISFTDELENPCEKIDIDTSQSWNELFEEMVKIMLNK